MNRHLVIVLAPLLAAGVLGSAGGAQPLAPDALDARLAGYPEMTIRLAEERIEAPASAAAGLTLLVEENATEEAGHAFVVRIPDDVTEAAVTKALAGGSAVEETPEWFWRAEFMGNGDRAVADRPAVALVNLEPGRYIAGDPFRPATEYARFEVTGNGAAESEPATAIDVDVTAELFEMGFRLPETVPAGRQLWEMKNAGAMLHEIAMFPVPDGARKDQIEAAMSAELSVEFGSDPAEARAEIDALGAEWSGWTANLVAGVGVLSPQRISWTQFNLEPGTYGAVCFVPEQSSGKAHLMLGMTEVFTVEAPSA